ncbi:hypothetical protein G7066_05795 [Leucobacter coleopterorum]|uniref:FtsX-like permease family protein n=1 Tax=Leucobacter coleopterorum TaxID=2714933 RepID=A0ABX6JVJ8_9MICO|nr:hypothetical protein [Leucobacter coleopterorum]QIM18287.1 hypothetical protein G7066_05795 [Leucobacter coleopterorum]
MYEYPSDGRRSGYGYAILSPVPDSGPFDECWIDVWPTIKEAPILLQTTLIPGGDKAEKAVLSQLNTSLGRAFDGNGKFLNRVTQFAPLAAVIIAFGIGFVSIRVRRIQLASAIHAGVSKLDLTILVTVETSSWVIPAGIFSAITATLFAASSTLGTSEATFVLALRVFGPALVAAVAGALVALGLTQEKHLFRYFKNR